MVRVSYHVELNKKHQMFDLSDKNDNTWSQSKLQAFAVPIGGILISNKQLFHCFVIVL
jgi:hypothetical protein